MNRRLKKIVSFLLIMLCSICAQIAHATSGKYYFHNYNMNDGLSSNAVRHIIQDRSGFVWIGTKDGLNRYDGSKFKVYKLGSSKNSIGNNFITALFEARDGEIWIGTNEGLYIYSPSTNLFRELELYDESGSQVYNSIRTIAQDPNGDMWISAQSTGLFRYNNKNRTTQHYLLPQITDIAKTTTVSSISFDGDGGMWLGLYGGGLLYSYDQLSTLTQFRDSANGEEIYSGDVIPKIIFDGQKYLYVSSLRHGLQRVNIYTDSVESILDKDSNGETINCQDMIIAKSNHIWAATKSGVYIYDLIGKSYEHLFYTPNDRYSISDDAINAICQGQDGGMWVGSVFGGINHYLPQYNNFEKFYVSPQNSGLKGSRIREFCEDADGIIWIGSEDGGLCTFDPQCNEFAYVEESRAFSNIHGLCCDGDYIWVCTFGDGIKLFDRKSRRVVKTYSNSKNNIPADDSVFSIVKLSDGTIYIGTTNGPYRYDADLDDFVVVKDLEGCFAYDIKEDRAGSLWIATYADGLYHYNPKRGEIDSYIHNKLDSHSLPDNMVVGIYIDSLDDVWVMTHGGGFCRYDNRIDGFYNYKLSDTYDSNVAYQIVEDDQGIYWITTNRGLLKFDRAEEFFTLYTLRDGLLDAPFNYRSSLKSKDKQIYLGTTNGFLRFNPSDIKDGVLRAPLYITDLYIAGEQMLVGDEGSPLESSLLVQDKIILKHNQNRFALTLASLDYSHSHRNNIEYILEGFDTQWRKLSELSSVSYTNVPYGNYRFIARVVKNMQNRSEQASKVELEIIITPPIYLSGWAYLIYFVIVVLMIYSIYRVLGARSRTKQQQRFDKFTLQKERELHSAKIELFTQVAHEIRTPLTLIKLPLDAIVERSETIDKETLHDLNIMQKNSDRLYYLINQLLDFRKVEQSNYHLNFVSCDVAALLNETYLRFTSMAKSKGVDFLLSLGDTSSCEAHVNRDAYIKIISNLINNAIKFSEKFVSIDFGYTPDLQQFTVEVVNDGEIIAADKRKSIFDAFVSIAPKDGSALPGSGIGLALALSFVELHGGSLELLDRADVNAFRLTLPLHQSSRVMPQDKIDLEQDCVTAESTEGLVQESVVEEHRSILIVEDNVEMLAFLKRQFAPIYNVFVAADGQQAISIIEQEELQLIITDLMMPKVDGFELCRYVKSNIESSHIPLILLTAKSNIQSKLEALEVGADLYIEKPFSIKYLIASAHNIIHSRELLKRSFAEQPLLSSTSVGVSKADKQFLKSLDEIVQANLSNAEFSIDEIAEIMCMSRSSFYRKIKGVLNLSPNEHLRIERLKRAAQLIKDNECRINEVSYLVGFNSHSYFTKCFYKHFGVYPKEFASQDR